VLLGDAAHIASPMVGAGFVSGLLDGAAIIRAIEQYFGTAADSGSRAIQRYKGASGSQSETRSREPRSNP
jgi:2-polyprenyl-6-methoxyphenol hydroxylase-like FAD-dependent oxidoreductase